MPKDTYYNLPDEKRRRVFEAAVEELVRAPESEISINRIVQNAGISRGSFYQYFEDKQDLLSYIFADYICRFREIVREAVMKADGSLFDAIEIVLGRMMELSRNVRVRNAMANVLKESGFGGCGVEAGAALQSEIIDILAEGADMNLLEAESRQDVERIARVLFVILKEAAAECLFDMEKAPEILQEVGETLHFMRDRMERR
ncbi:MAG: TetR/AcrR family transcriptional regulator [Emergencia sp.]